MHDEEIGFRVGGAAERAKRALAAILGQRRDQRDDRLGDRFRLSLIRSLKSNIYTVPSRSLTKRFPRFNAVMAGR